jgi:hypothetical protein
MAARRGSGAAVASRDGEGSMAQEVAAKGGGALFWRIALGFVWGVCLYWVSNFRLDKPLWGLDAADWPHWVQAMRTLAVFAPLPLLFGLGNLPASRLILWSITAAIVLAFVGWLAPAPVWSGAPPVITVWLFSLIVVYIVHEFVQAAHDDDRPVARYETYFDLSWRHAFQAGLALIFAGAFWIVLWLGAWLFKLIGVSFFEELILTQEFSWPATALAVALGVHLTDASSGLTRGARQIGLTLLSWLAILMTIILTGFLASLPFTGLEPLWDTKRATVLLLNAAATMILLINAAFQAGDPPKSAIVRAIVRFSAFPLLGVVGLAALGLWMRVDQYGLTPARVVAGAELAIVAFYAVGYAWAALPSSAWMSRVKPVNTTGAALVAAILLALMTPLLDPARVSVADQVARLESGRVEPDDFDFGFLANERSSHWGPTALKRLAAKSGSERDERIAYLAANPGAQSAFAEQQTFNDRRRSLKLLGPGEIPDAALLRAASGSDPIEPCVRALKQAEEQARIDAEGARRAARLSRRPPHTAPLPLDGEPPPATPEEARCPARLMDLDNDGDTDLLIAQTDSFNPKTSAVISFAAILRNKDIWRATGTGRERFALPADADWRDDRARIDAAVAAVVAIPTDRLDFIIDGRRVRWFPTPERVTTAALRSALSMTNGASAPEALFAEPAVEDNLLVECASEATRMNGTNFACFGKRADATGDYAPEFLLVQLGDFQTTANVNVYAEADGKLKLLGSAYSAYYAREEVSGAAVGETKEEFLARERARIMEEFRTAPSLIADLDAGGQRIRFDYPPEIVDPRRAPGP